MEKQESLISKLWKSGLVFGLFILALYWAWIVGGSFIHLSMFIYKHLGKEVLYEGLMLTYIVILFATIVAVSGDINMTRQKRTPKRRLIWKIALTWALIPGANMLMPLVLFCYGVMKIGIHGAAWIIVLFETVYAKQEETL